MGELLGVHRMNSVDQSASSSQRSSKSSKSRDSSISADGFAPSRSPGKKSRPPANPIPEAHKSNILEQVFSHTCRLEPLSPLREAPPPKNPNPPTQNPSPRINPSHRRTKEAKPFVKLEERAYQIVYETINRCM